MSERIPVDATHRGQDAREADLVVRSISTDDVFDALKQGWRDFKNAPVYGLVFGAIFALGGIAIAAWAYERGLSYLMYPAIIGFAMIGPFAAVGLYEVSRLQERGQRPSWGAIARTLVAQGGAELAWMAFVTLFIFMAWIYAAQMLVAIFFGLRAFSTLSGFLALMATTPEGWLFLIVGNLLGAATLFAVFSLTVVSVPLLLDREVDFVTAMITSLRAVAASPGPMLIWAAIVFATLLIAALPAFLGLLVAVPVLSFATWRLYRMIVTF
ncbi:DUF2189 domain-containing protein [Methylocella silvestris]|uniref:DUF2189 domain-containing protein n=1 Tax=Methylocella silvestris TaxID=199596 RepID=A0A2J7TKG8_METSI|nr:DUF2189 domain-containing protein [Methylocella silvestris]PNG27266.1 hypothetical protein CR492_04085 [Methylocella silvestris]